VDTPVSHAELDATLAQARLGVGASDLHGSLAGYLSGGGRAGPRNFLKALQLESGDAHAGDQVHAVLERLYRGCLDQLDDPGLGFAPLLPGDDRALDERADALVEWCRGFLGGFGLAGGGGRRLSADGSEILGDFGTIAAAPLAVDSAHEDDDERALVEVVEFVRVGTLLLHAEVAAQAPPPADAVH
jgi:uncharacterized protein YgfB (UPF0149 family)